MRKRKWWSIAAAVVLAAVLLVPVRVNLKDGGSVRYRALLYEVTKIHQLAPEVKGVNRVLYDLTPKPTGTIEWE